MNLQLQYKLLEPVLFLGMEQFPGVDIRVRVKGGGHVDIVDMLLKFIYFARLYFHWWVNIKNVLMMVAP